MNLNGVFSLNRTIFSENSFFENIIHLQNTKTTYIENCTFNENRIYSHVFNIKDAINLNLHNVEFFKTNSKEGQIFYEGGGVLRISNVLYCLIDKMEISYSYNEKTSFGLKIIDDFNENIINENILPFVNFLKIY